jgi:ribosome-binding protein aMBF1 (putative translation factor)
MTTYLNDYQSNLNELQGYDALDEGSVDKFMEDELGMVGQAPEAPKYRDMYDDMRKEYGVDELEQSMNWYKDMIRREELLLNQQKNYMREQPVRMGVIEGRVDKATRDRQEQIQWYGNELQRTADMAQSAYGQIQMIMQLTQMDYETAKDQYQTEFNNRMTVYKSLADQFNADRAFASTQWSMMASYISKGQMTWDDMSTDQKAQVAKYEAIMGMPIGFMSKLQMEAGANIISSTQRVAPDGYTYIDMVYQDKNGATKVKSVRTGRARVSGGSSSSSSQNKLFTEASKLLEDYEGTLQKEIYRDGTDNEQMADKLMADWEIDRAIGRFKEVYGDELGEELFNYAWTMGGYEEWTK